MASVPKLTPEEVEQAKKYVDSLESDASIYARLPRAPSGEALLSEELIAAYEQLMLEGNTRINSARICGVQRSTVARWLTKGRDDISKGKHSLYSKFVWTIDRCEGGQERRLVNAAMRAATHLLADGTLALKILERRAPEDWAPAIPEAADGTTQFVGMSATALKEEAKRVLLTAANEAKELPVEVVPSTEDSSEG